MLTSRIFVEHALALFCFACRPINFGFLLPVLLPAHPECSSTQQHASMPELGKCHLLAGEILSKLFCLHLLPSLECLLLLLHGSLRASEEDRSRSHEDAINPNQHLKRGTLKCVPFLPQLFHKGAGYRAWQSRVYEQQPFEQRQVVECG